MLIQAPVFNATNPKTTLPHTADCSHLIDRRQWASLPSSLLTSMAFQNGMNATYFYIPRLSFCMRVKLLTIQGFANAALNVTARIHDVFNQLVTSYAMSIATNVVSVFAPNLLTRHAGTFSGLTAVFLNGHECHVTSASPTSFTAIYARELREG